MSAEELKKIDRAMENLSDENLLLSFVRKHVCVTGGMIQEQFPSRTGEGIDPNILEASGELIRAGKVNYEIIDGVGIMSIKNVEGGE